jgi:type I restriction enzyme M protein
LPQKRSAAGRKSKQTPQGNGNGIAALTAQLWQAAVSLRGSIEPADYKRYVLPIIFLRFLSLRYERRRAELERLIADPGSEYHTTDPSIAVDILDDPDEYRRAGAFVVLANARWSEIRRHAQADDIKVRLDDILDELERAYPDKLRGLLPRIYAASNLDRENVTALINLFSKDIFEQDHGGEDLIGRVYEYFIGEFASSEGKRGGEYFTPLSVVRTLVAMLEPERGVVLDPCCGSGGMFVQADEFTRHNHELSFVGQESKDFTYRLCRMNLFIHGLDGRIELGNSYFNDLLANVKADYLLANPPFNDGSKGENGWGAERVPAKDPRLQLGERRVTLSPRNANTMWILHFLYHLKSTGSAGFVMATGELSNGETARREVRQALVDSEYVDCIVQLSGQLFANTQIPCALWFLSKNRGGTGGFRERSGEILFLDGRKLGSLILGSRKQKELSGEELERMAAVYRTFKRTGVPEAVPGFCRVAKVEEVRAHGYALTPGRYVGSPESDEDEEPFEEKMPRLVAALEHQFGEGRELEAAIRQHLRDLNHG